MGKSAFFLREEGVFVSPDVTSAGQGLLFVRRKTIDSVPVDR